jgi:two-component system, sensor histidine kinase PdtaS
VTDPAKPDAVDHATAATDSRPRRHRAEDERQELDHRLANSLQLAADFLIFEHMRVTDPRAREALIQTAERLSAVGQMHRFLAAQRRALGVDLDRFLTELGGLITDSTGLECDVDCEAITAPGETAQHLAIVVNELAMNAAKHAYAWGDRGALHITCRRQGARLVIVVADDGEGLDKAFIAKQSRGLGMTIVDAIVRQLQGTLEAVNDHGARFTISIPLPSAPPAISRSFAPPEPPD